MAKTIYAVALICLRMPLISAMQMISGASNQCSAGSQMFAVPASHQKPNVSFDVVTLADYPSAGSTWLRRMLSFVSTAETLRSPICSIYFEKHRVSVDGLPGVLCDDQSWNSSMGSLLVKSHFPVQQLLRGESFDDWMYAPTMTFDRLIMLVRHPVSLLASYQNRWSRSVGNLTGSALADNLHCWASWWKLVGKGVDKENFYMLRYEDLCRNTSQGLFGVFQFLGGRYAEISLDSIHQALSNQSFAKCMYVDKLDNMSAIKGPMDQTIVDKLHDFMLEWGYAV